MRSEAYGNKIPIGYCGEAFPGGDQEDQYVCLQDIGDIKGRGV